MGLEVPSRHREISNYRPQQLVREYPGGLTQFCNLDLAISIGLQTPLIMPGQLLTDDNLARAAFRKLARSAGARPLSIITARTRSGARIGSPARRSASSTRRDNSPCSNHRSDWRILLAGIVFGFLRNRTTLLPRRSRSRYFSRDAVGSMRTRTSAAG